MNDDDNNINPYINLKEASKLTSKSTHTIRKLAQNERIKSTYTASNGVKKLLVSKNDLISHYDISLENKEEDTSTTPDNDNGLSLKYLIELHNKEKKEIREHYEKLLQQQSETYSKQLETLQNQIDKQRDTHEKQMAVLESIVKTKNFKELQSPNEENHSKKTSSDSSKKEETGKKGILARLFS